MPFYMVNARIKGKMADISEFFLAEICSPFSAISSTNPAGEPVTKGELVLHEQCVTTANYADAYRVGQRKRGNAR